MGGHQGRESLLRLKRFEVGPELSEGSLIQALGRLIHQQNPRTMDEGSGELEAAAHATGPLGDLLLRARCQLDQLEHLADASSNCSPWQAIQPDSEHEVLLRGELLIEAVLLENNPHLSAQGRIFNGQLAAMKVKLPRVCTRSAGENLKCRRSAGSIRAQHAEDCTVGHA